MAGDVAGKPGRAVPRSAVALAYSQTEAAPTVLAKGRGELADRIIQKAREAGVYVHESPDLVRLLLEVDLDTQIPPALYRAVAEVLAWLYRIERGEAAGLPPVATGLPETLRTSAPGEAPVGEA